MKLKSLLMLSAMTWSMSSAVAYADMLIANNTETAATAYAGSSPCSNAAGDRGVIKPHSSVQVPDFVIGIYCTHNCTAEVFMNKNCSGKSIASVIANKKDGVVSITNHDVDGYRVVGTGKSVSVEGGPARKWYQLFF